MTLSGIVRVIALAAALGAAVPTVPDAAAAPAAPARPGVTVPPVLGKFCGRFKVWGPRWAIFAAAVPCSVAVGIVRNHADEPVPPKRAPYPPLALHARWPVACVGGPDAGSLPASLVCGKQGTNMPRVRIQGGLTRRAIPRTQGNRVKVNGPGRALRSAAGSVQRLQRSCQAATLPINETRAERADQWNAGVAHSAHA
jgi:hypothetical protein